MRTHRESWEPGKQMPLRYLGIAKLDRADGVGHPIGTDVERIGKQRLARMNRCALPDVVADIVRVALSHHLDVAAAGGPDGAANAVPGVTEATAIGPNGVGDAGHILAPDAIVVPPTKHIVPPAPPTDSHPDDRTPVVQATGPPELEAAGRGETG